MRKTIINRTGSTAVKDESEEVWLDLEHLAQVELTSEDSNHPFESALKPGIESYWRAESPGQQTIRLIFDEPQQLTRILLLFIEFEAERTQEYLLRWSNNFGKSFHEIVRQRWNFSPSGSTRQLEDHRLSLTGVTTLELNIAPDVSGRDVRASLTELRIA